MRRVHRTGALPATPARLLVVQTAFVGDVVLTTPLLELLRRNLPRTELGVLTTPAGAALLEDQPQLGRVWVFDKRGDARGLRGLWRAAAALRRARFEAALAAHRSVRTALLLAAARIPRRIGFATAPGRWLYTERVAWPEGGHASARYLALAAPLGLAPNPGDDTHPRLVPAPAAAARVAHKLAQRGLAGSPLALIAPGSVWPTKRWLADGFVTVARALREAGLSVIVTGSEAERQLVEEVARRSGATALAGADLTLPELLALAARARVFLGNDSGASHIAAAAGTPTVVLFGPTHPSQGLGPQGCHVRVVQHETLACRPCHIHGPRRCPLGHFRCMRELEAAAVLEAVRRAAADVHR